MHVDTCPESEGISEPRTPRPQQSGRVGFVEHQERTVPVLEIDQLPQGCPVAIHAEHAFRDYQHPRPRFAAEGIRPAEMVGQHVEVDARPSDALALAVSRRTPIEVDEEVVREASDERPDILPPIEAGEEDDDD